MKRLLVRIVVGLGFVAALLVVPVSEKASAEPVTPTKVLTIIEENHSYTQMKSQMPYLFTLAQKYAYASNYFGVSHPSLPNYLAIAGGSTFGITDDRPPSINAPKVGNAKTIFGLALEKGKTAKTYAESMPGTCALFSSGTYAVKHNPWAYFSAGRSRCSKFAVPMTGFLADAKANNLPNAGVVVPNLCHDAHNCALSVANAWLKKYLPTVLASADFTSGRLTVVVTADEDDRSSGNKVLTVAMNAALDGKVVTTKLTHYSLCGYYSHVLGAHLLGRSIAGFSTAFGL
ncbi:MAG: alkaline phosphatase family protein [Nocardioidaceae bacterium]